MLLAYIAAAGTIGSLILLAKRNQKQGWRKQRISWNQPQILAAQRAFAASINPVAGSSAHASDIGQLPYNIWATYHAPAASPQRKWETRLGSSRRPGYLPHSLQRSESKCVSMISVTPGTETTLAPITDPALTIQATILSADGRYAELALHSGAPLSPGTLIQFQSLETLYLGEIESQLRARSRPHPD